jgi:tRNA-Thr(GGU) m(6)t(6)A37 methyltransferase TsaA
VATFEVRPVGHVESTLTDLESAPKQTDEGAPPAWLVFAPDYLEALSGLRVGHDVIVLTWLDRARRDVLSVHPRGDVSQPRAGVFSTRAPYRPNPIGLHRSRILEIAGTRVKVHSLEALNGTPIVDIKPVLDEDISRR